MKQVSDTKARLLELLKTPLEKPYEYTVDFGDGARTVQNIRIELSRIRRLMQENEIAFQQFMVRQHIQQDRTAGKDHVILIRYTKDKHDMSSVAKELMDAMKVAG